MRLETWGDIPSKAIVSVSLVEQRTELKVRSYRDARVKVNRYRFKVLCYGAEFRRYVEIPSTEKLSLKDIKGEHRFFEDILYCTKETFEAFLSRS